MSICLTTFNKCSLKTRKKEEGERKKRRGKGRKGGKKKGGGTFALSKCKDLLKFWERWKSTRIQECQLQKKKKKSYAKVWELFSDVLWLIHMIFWEGGVKEGLFSEILSYSCVPLTTDPVEVKSSVEEVVRRRLPQPGSQLLPTWKWLNIHQATGEGGINEIIQHDRIFLSKKERWSIDACPGVMDPGNMMLSGSSLWLKAPKCMTCSCPIPEEANAQRQKAS